MKPGTVQAARPTKSPSMSGRAVNEAGVRGIDAATVENGHRLSRRAEELVQGGANQRGDGLDVGGMAGVPPAPIDQTGS